MCALAPNAVKVFEWKFFEIYNREQELYDGTTRIFEKCVRYPSAWAFAIQDDKILIAYQQQPHKKDPYYGHLGWMLGKDEDPLEWIKREFLEETWMIAEEYEFYKYYEFPGVLEWSKYFYILRGVKKIQEQQLDQWSEIITVKAVTFDEYIDLVCTGQIRERWVREEIMLMKIQGKLDEFKKLLFRS